MVKNSVASEFLPTGDLDSAILWFKTPLQVTPLVKNSVANESSNLNPKNSIATEVFIKIRLQLRF